MFRHKPFRVLADHLSRAGIAVLRVDDAAAGDSTPHPSPPTTLDFAADAGAGFDYLRSDPRTAAAGLIGHSEGGLIAAMLAGSREDLSFIVLMAAGGGSGRRVNAPPERTPICRATPPEATTAMAIGVVG